VHHCYRYLGTNTMERVDVVVVGAGISGISLGHYLRTLCPSLTVAILERREAVGGTWDLNQYPGIRSVQMVHRHAAALEIARLSLSSDTLPFRLPAAPISDSRSCTAYVYWLHLHATTRTAPRSSIHCDKQTPEAVPLHTCLARSSVHAFTTIPSRHTVTQERLGHVYVRVCMAAMVGFL
jgi:choline dehydrogenase-like flavoprotein